MKKILLTLMLLVLFIPVVNAEVDDACTLVASYSSNDTKFILNTKYYHYYLNTNDRVAVNTDITSDYYYTIYFDNADSINLNNYAFGFSGSTSLTITKNDYYYVFNTYYNYSPQFFTDVLIEENWNNLYIYSSENEIACIPLAESEPEPEPDPIIPDTTLDNFYTICINKLVELSNFMIENKFALSAFVIIIFFTIIGLFIHLFKGGRKQ